MLGNDEKFLIFIASAFMFILSSIEWLILAFRPCSCSVFNG